MRLLAIAFVTVMLAGFRGADRVYGDGLIVVPPSPQNPGIGSFPLEVRYHHVETAIEDMVATTSVDQEFYNPSDRRIEGYYLFPIPERAIISGFSMFINGKETEAEMLDAVKARTVYEEIVRKLVDPALLEYYGLGMLRARIFPIEPHSAKRVKLSYRQTLEKNNGTIGYIYGLNTEKYSAVPVHEVSLKVTITAKGSIKNVYCPSHEAEIVRKDSHHAVIGYEAREVKPDKDFAVYYTTDSSKFGISLLTYREKGSDGFFFLNISPDYEIGKNEIEEKDIAFVLDASGSMAGKKLAQAKKALSFCIENLNKGDRFEVIRFSTEAEALFGKPTAADSSSRARALAYVNDLRAIGGTNMEEALKLAFAGKNDGSRPYMVIFITDGKPTIGVTGDDDLLKMISRENNRRTRVFTFGIGDEINTHLLDKLTEATGAWRTYVTEAEDIEVKVSDLYAKVQSPVFTGLALAFGKNIDTRLLYPRELPDLFRGSSITVIGRYRGQGNAEVQLTGFVKGKRQRIVYSSEFPSVNSQNQFIGALWAARRTGFLLDQIRLNGEDKELVDEVTVLARTYGIITPYTSYLIVEDEDARVRESRLPESRRSMSGILRNKLSSQAPATSGSFGGPDGVTEFEKKMDYGALKAKEGRASAQASSEVQELSRSVNADQMMQGKARLDYKAKDGSTRNMIDNVRQVNGRAFYNNGSNWVDAACQLQKDAAKKVRIKFADTAYFELLKKYPVVARYMALGKSVTFVMDAVVYEVYE